MVSQFGEQLSSRIDELFGAAEQILDDPALITLGSVLLRGKQLSSEAQFTGTVSVWRELRPAEQAENPDYITDKALHLTICSSPLRPAIPLFRRSLHLRKDGFRDEFCSVIPLGEVVWCDAPPENTAAVFEGDQGLQETLLAHSLGEGLWPGINEATKAQSLETTIGIATATQMKIAIDRINRISVGGLMVIES